MRSFFRLRAKNEHRRTLGQTHRRPGQLARFRPWLEPLEPRIVLTTPTITGVAPLPNTHGADPDGTVTATFGVSINPLTVSDQTLAVYGMQSGRYLEPPHSIGASGNKATFDPSATAGFFPGEPIHVSITPGVEDPAGDSATPFVWQFRTATGQASAYFEDSSQSLERSIGIDVNLGDLDGDLDLDAFIVGNTGSEVWFNDGKGVFANSGKSIGNGNSQDAALADLDGDGDLDAVVVGNLNNRVWFNDGRGMFTDSGQRLGSNDSHGVALADLDGNGTIDAFIANGEGAPNKVWLNDGDGMFSDSGQNLGTSDSWAVALGDLDGNGTIDAFVGNSGSNAIEPNKVWLNDGNGNFTPTAQNIGASSTVDVQLADLNGDSVLDAVVGGANNEIWTNNGSGTFNVTGQKLGNEFGRSVALADLDGDGNVDVYLGNASRAAPGDGAANTVWRNNGNASFTKTSQNIGSFFTSAVALGDVDGNGTIDALIGNEKPRGAISPFTEPTQVFVNDGAAIFSDTGQVIGLANTQTMALGDLDGDGDLDVFVGNFGAANQVWRNDSKGFMLNTGQNLGGSRTWAVGLGDVDGDGDVDAYEGTAAGEANRLWINDGAGRFTASSQNLGTSLVLGVALGDVDGDGDLDAVVVGAGNEVWLNDGGVFTKSNSSLGSQTSRDVQLGDFDGDGDLDAFIANSGSEPNKIWINNGSGTFADSGQNLGSSNSRRVALGDVDRDGDLDAVVANTANQPDDVWLNDGGGTFIRSPQNLGDRSSQAVSLGDLDGDRDLDAFIVSDVPRVWLNDGGGIFFESNQVLTGVNGRYVSLGDLDGDGDIDAVVGSENATNKVLENLAEVPVQPDRFEPNNTSATATSLDTTPFSLTGQLRQSFEGLTLHQPDGVDWYKWRAPESGTLTVDVLFDHDLGDLELRLFNSSQTEQLAASNSDDDNESVTHAVVGGQDYYVRVTSFGPATHPDYDLLISGSEFVPDVFEGDTGNDSRATAANLGSISRAHTGLTIHNPGNDDWFRITPATNELLEVDILFTHALGDLEMYLLDSTGNQLRSSLTSTNNEQISFNVLAGRTYYVQVEGFDDETSPSYELRVDLGNSAPSISNITAQTVNEDTATPSLPFTIGDAETPLGSLSLRGESSNKTLVPDANIVFGGSGGSRTVRVTPAANQFGTSLISVIVQDTNGATATDVFLLTVNPVNDRPTISAIGPQTIDEDSISDPISFTIGDLETSASALSVSASSNDESLIPDGNIIVAGSTGSRTVRLNPLPNEHGGPVSITISVSDGTDTTSRTFPVTVRSVNDLPTISDIIGQQVEEDTATPPIPFAVGDLETSPNSLLITATSSNQTLVPNGNISLGGSGTNRTLTITPSPNRSGLATITVTVNDGDGGTATDTFVLNVGEFNDDPTISAIADAVTNEDTPTAAIAFTVDDTETAPNAITVSGTSNNTSLVPDGNIVIGGTGGSRTVTVTPAANQFGSAIVTVRADDGSGGTATSSFFIAVNAVNDAPVNSVPGTQVINEDTSLEFSDVNGNRISIADVDAGSNNVLVTLIVSKGALNAVTAAGVTVTGNGTGTVSLAGSTSNVNAALNGLLYTPLLNSHASDSLRIITNDQGNSGSGGIKTISNTVLIIVAAVNDDPRITSPSEVTMLENSTAALTVTAADPDGDVPIFSIINGPDRSQFAIGAASGALRFLTAPDFENPADSDGDNVYQVDVRVEDGNGGVTTQLISVSVANVDETAPTVSILDVAPNPRAQAVEDISFVFSEAVTGFDVSDLSLNRSTDQTVGLLPGSATLTTTDNRVWRLQGLGELTADAGIYELSITAAGSGIQDLQGTGLAQDQSIRWTNGAGDVDGDRDFDQFDLISLLQSDLYLTGQPATWSQGDWNGDGVFDQRDILVSLQTQPSHYLQGPFGAARPTATSPRAPVAPEPIEPGFMDASSTGEREAVSDQVFAAIGSGS